jgi:hypothetical protein
VGSRSSELGTVVFTPFRNLESAQKTNVIVYTLDTYEDIKNLKDFSKTLIKGNSLFVPVNLVNFDSLFLRECMWGESDCPASRFRMAIIGKDGSSISPCLRSTFLADISDNFEDIKQEIESLWINLRKKRGCDSCPIKKYCSKCMFPYPLADQEYCRLRNKNPEIVKLINSLKITRKMQMRSSLGGKIKDHVKIGFGGDLCIIDIGSRRYLYNLRTDNFYEATTG